MPKNDIAGRQTELLKVEAIRAYFDFTKGRPTAKSVAKRLGVSEPLVKSWIADNRNGELLDEIVPLWPNMVEARAYASANVQLALETVVDIMKNGKAEGNKLAAANLILGLAGVRPPKEGEEVEQVQNKRPAVLLNLFLGGGQEPIQIVEGEAREIVVERVQPKQLEAGG